jgi:deoxyribodipyrimidine photo-lyase
MARTPFTNVFDTEILDRLPSRHDRRVEFIELASNNGGWQWAASTGCDAQPCFRIFNPVTRSRNFDPRGKFIRERVPELSGCEDRIIHAPWLMGREAQRRAKVRVGKDYPALVVEHDVQRKRALALYRAARDASD